MLAYGDSPVRLPKLRVPARDIHKRPFVVSPMVHLQPDLRIPGKESRTVLEWSALLQHHLPLWMGIVNVTPDSFSDGGLHTRWSQIEPHLDAMTKAGGHIIDLGAESTRPGATPLSAAEEWTRLQPVLERTQEKLSAEPLPPRVSVDTRRPEVATQAIARGVAFINDVGGLSDPAMLELARSSRCDWVVMHHLTIPANPKMVIDTNQDPLDVVETWLQLRLEQWDKAGLDLNRIILDPGIGFGKNALQSLELMRRLKRLRSHGLRLLVGHSRKSFMHGFAGQRIRERDLATVGVSLALCQQGVDIIRVHDVPGHVAAYRGWAHLQCQSLRHPKTRQSRKT
jgi:dihydropteroate synthase